MDEKELLFRAVFWGSIIRVFIISLIAGGIFSLIGFAFNKTAGCLLAGFTIFTMLVCGPALGFYNGSQATGPDWEGAIDDKSTYLEKLHGVWSRYDVISHICEYRDNDMNINDTGCEYVTVSSYCDSYDEGDCDDTDYKFYPWFIREETLTAELNIFKRGHVVFASHHAPQNWQDYAWYLPHGAAPGVDFKYGRPVEWLRVQEAIDSGRILPGSVWNPYFNWIYADDYTILEEYSPHIEKYRQVGLLPTINPIRDTIGNEVYADIYGNVTGIGFDYNIVQFLGLQVHNEADWQYKAHLWGGMAGPEIQASLILFFAPASQIADRFEWMQTSKAYLMTEEANDGAGFGRYILPKNIILIGCGIDSGYTVVEWCVAQTGMFKGNEQFIQDVQQLQPFQFSPESIFGNMDASFKVGDDGQFVIEDPDWDDRDMAIMMPHVEFSGGVIDSVIRDKRAGHGFHRLEMKNFEGKRIVVQPDPEQIDDILANKKGFATQVIIGIWIVITFLAGATTKRSSKS